MAARPGAGAGKDDGCRRRHQPVGVTVTSTRPAPDRASGGLSPAEPGRAGSAAVATPDQVLATRIQSFLGARGPVYSAGDRMSSCDGRPSRRTP
jgi:hypothetical protein